MSHSRTWEAEGEEATDNFISTLNWMNLQSSDWKLTELILITEWMVVKYQKLRRKSRKMKEIYLIHHASTINEM